MTSEKPAICGTVHAATAEGFARFLVDANRALADGYELITVVRLDGKIAGVYRRLPNPESGGSFFE